MSFALVLVEDFEEGVQTKYNLLCSYIILVTDNYFFAFSDDPFVKQNWVNQCMHACDVLVAPACGVNFTVNHLGGRQFLAPSNAGVLEALNATI